MRSVDEQRTLHQMQRVAVNVGQNCTRDALTCSEMNFLSNGASIRYNANFVGCAVRTMVRVTHPTTFQFDREIPRKGSRTLWVELIRSTINLQNELAVE